MLFHYKPKKNCTFYKLDMYRIYVRQYPTCKTYMIFQDFLLNSDFYKYDFQNYIFFNVLIAEHAWSSMSPLNFISM